MNQSRELAVECCRFNKLRIIKELLKNSSIISLDTANDNNCIRKCRLANRLQAQEVICCALGGAAKVYLPNLAANFALKPMGKINLSHQTKTL
jgi:hypothetical protein